MKRRNKFLLSLTFLACLSSFGQTSSSPQKHIKTIAYKAEAKQKSSSQNKSSLIWGAGSLGGTAPIGEFSTAFNTAGSWTATSYYDANGAPGNAFWTRSTLGYSQGAYWGGTTPINSPSAANGVAIFDSDFMDNGGVQGNFGLGSSPSAHSGLLLSPAIDLTGYTDSALTLKFYTFRSDFSVTEFSVGFSTDGGATYSTTSIPNLISNSTEGFVEITLPNATAGVVNLTDCRIRFVFDGDYYFAISR